MSPSFDEVMELVRRYGWHVDGVNKSTSSNSIYIRLRINWVRIQIRISDHHPVRIDRDEIHFFPGGPHTLNHLEKRLKKWSDKFRYRSHKERSVSLLISESEAKWLKRFLSGQEPPDHPLVAKISELLP